MRFTRRSPEHERALVLALGVVTITSCATVSRSSNDPPPSEDRPADGGGAMDASVDSAPPVVRREAGARR
ncbi:MAG: hypothetical protein K0S65_4023, partial [Labilithrix sp.]|nr:hypothetical protein [Labilithrix sp.]